ncbi:MAG: hypothetical protein HC896_00430 [Bacteroidales bacterium]|nr:hypothetical protein [Bacteroidales bacterium]
METISIEYSTKRRHLKVFVNGKLRGGMIGHIAEQRYMALLKETNKIDTYTKIAINGNKTKTPKV